MWKISDAFSRDTYSIWICGFWYENSVFLQIGLRKIFITTSKCQEKKCQFFAHSIYLFIKRLWTQNDQYMKLGLCPYNLKNLSKNFRLTINQVLKANTVLCKLNWNDGFESSVNWRYFFTALSWLIDPLHWFAGLMKFVFIVVSSKNASKRCVKAPLVLRKEFWFLSLWVIKDELLFILLRKWSRLMKNYPNLKYMAKMSFKTNGLNLRLLLDPNLEKLASFALMTLERMISGSIIDWQFPLVYDDRSDLHFYT